MSGVFEVLGYMGLFLARDYQIFMTNIPQPLPIPSGPIRMEHSLRATACPCAYRGKLGRLPKHS